VRLAGLLVSILTISVAMAAPPADNAPMPEVPKPVLLKFLKANGVSDPWYVYQGNYSSGDDGVHGLVETWLVDVFVEPRQIEPKLCAARSRTFDIDRKNGAYVAGKFGSDWRRVLGIGTCEKESATKFAEIKGDMPDDELRNAVHYSLTAIGDHEPIAGVRFESEGLKKELRSASPAALALVSKRGDHLDFAFYSRNLSPNFLGMEADLKGQPSAYVYEESYVEQFDIYAEVKSMCKLGDGSPISPECRGYITGIVGALEIADVSRDPNHGPRLCIRGVSGIDQVIEKIRPALRRDLNQMCAGLCTSVGRVAESLYETFPCDH
jgi:hypothetical protein